MEKDNTQKRIEELEKRIDDLEQLRNLDTLKLTREKLIGRSFGDDDSSVQIVKNFTVSLVSGAGSVTVLDFPDEFLDLVKPNGDRVRVPVYSLSRF